MVTLIELYKYSVICSTDTDHIVSHYLTKSGEWRQLLIGTIKNPPSFESTQYVVYSPTNVFHPLALLKNNPQAQAEYLLDVINTYKES